MGELLLLFQQVLPNGQVQRLQLLTPHQLTILILHHPIILLNFISLGRQLGIPPLQRPQLLTTLRQILLHLNPILKVLPLRLLRHPRQIVLQRLHRHILIIEQKPFGLEVVDLRLQPALHRLELHVGLDGVLDDWLSVFVEQAHNAEAFVLALLLLAEVKGESTLA